ncbi:MAG: peptidylprolyl isomerase [Bacteroidales bacterium]|nr:peptidylprolyl isomerase [Bacteroidales bacterium]
MKKSFFFALCATTLLLTACGGGKKQGGTSEPAPAQEPEKTEVTKPDTGKETVEPKPDLTKQYEPKIKIETSEGDIVIKLYEETPLHKDNFIKLAQKHFYDGILFHRIINGFMIQTGDPLTKDSTKINAWGTGGPGYTIPAEIVKGLTHKKGALAAARRGDMVNPAKESSGSQFYIVQDENGCRHLDGEYTIFGEVVKGLNIIDKIAAKRTDGRDRPSEPIQIISVTPVE